MKTHPSRSRAASLLFLASSMLISVLLASCGGGDGAAPSATADAVRGRRAEGLRQAAPVGLADANRLAQQATFGPDEAMVAAIQASGPAAWIQAQMALSGAQYTSGGDDEIDTDHRHGQPFCHTPPHDDPNCYVEYRTSLPLMEDFYRNATTLDDQLHQRAALALQHIFVISSVTIQRTYGMRNYFNALMDNALGNYRDVLRSVALSPVMGDYLNNANNDKAAPNENFAREQLQLFSLGPCLLELDGTLTGGTCQPVYDNDMVRAYAFAMTGWTYPKGGNDHRNCLPVGTNCQYYNGNMVAVAARHDTGAHTLLSNVTVPAGSKAPQALELVLDSIMAHPNIGPFVAQRMIQDFVTSNPSPKYVARVATAFDTGLFASGGASFGSGAKGDLRAVIAAVLLDAEAHANTFSSRSQGFLRDPILFFTGTLRGLNGKSDGREMGAWGTRLHEDVFRPPSVFDFYSPDYPVAGTNLVGPQFGIHNANGALDRLNFLDFLLYQGGAKAIKKDPHSLGTQIDDTAFLSSAGDAGVLVDRLSLLAFGHTLPAITRQPVIDAVTYWDTTTAPGDAWQHKRVSTAAYLVYGSPDYQVQR
jgi:uncharacterized protein (DUF1800 family)